MKSLVTGGAGFIGSHVADHLIAQGHDVVVIDDLSGGYQRNIPEQARFVNTSICNIEDVNSLFEEERFDYVFHLAAYAAEGLSHFIRRFNYENNVLGSINLINAAVNSDSVRCFVFTSSIAVYGDINAAAHENDHCLPIDPYGIAKLAVEQDIRSACEMFDLPFIIFRPHNVYGPRQNLADPYRNVIGIFLNQAMRSEPLTIFGDGIQTRAFSYIDDVAPLIAKSVQIPAAYGNAFNIGAQERASVIDVAQYVSTALNVPLNIQHFPKRHEATHVWSNHERSIEVFGDFPTVSLETGIKAMAQWAIKVGAHQPSSLVQKVEVSRNLPPSWAHLLASSKKMK